VSGGAIFYGDKIIDRFENRQAISSAQGRLDQFAMALPLIEKYPIAGIGPGVSDFFSRWSDNRMYVRKALSRLDMPNYIHCGQLQILVESGIPGLVLFLAIVGAIIWSAFGRIRPGMESGTFDLLRVGGISGALAIMIHISFGTEFTSQHIFQLFWVLLGLARNQRYDKRGVPGTKDISQ
jgi:O-antigen ligase